MPVFFYGKLGTYNFDPFSEGNTVSKLCLGKALHILAL